MHLRILFVLSSVLSATIAQDVRELSVPTGAIHLASASTTTINNTVNSGYRLVDIEYVGPDLLGTVRYNAELVQNSGPYAAGWWWYTGVTAAQIGTYLNSNQARLIDLEPYEDTGGNLRFACVMVDNTGANAKAWWWYYNTTTTGLANAVATNNARVVDLDSYTIGTTSYYSGVMIANSGNDARGWWWYFNVTPAQIGGYVNANNAQLYDLERRSNGNWDCVMLQNPTPAAWHWWYDQTAANVTWLLGQYGVRAFDIESYVVSGSRRYAILTINNGNALTTSVGDDMRALTDGQVGCWLQQINGPNLANLNGDTVFEPASTMKTLHHVHAMRQVRLGLPLTTMLTVYSQYSTTNQSCPIDVGPFQEPLQTVLADMMENSDNARTQAVRAWFTQTSINATAAALGMGNTSLNHRIGCGAEAIPNPNEITLHDLHTLHTAVVNGYLATHRPLFYSLMVDDVFGTGFATIAQQEASLLGLSSATVTTFLNLCGYARKGGSYDHSTGGPFWYERASFGWLSLPFLSGGNLAPREYGVGAFVNDASNASGAAAALTAGTEGLLRHVVRQALQTWTNNVATVATVGSGCGGYQQTVGGLPRLGTNVYYNGVNGYAGAITLFGLGFSNSSWNGVPLPASLAPFGGGPGCVALNEIVLSDAAVAGATGNSSFGVAIPGAFNGLGFQYFTQCYSFGPTTFRTSNGVRSTVGL